VGHSLKSGSPGKEKRRLSFKRDDWKLLQNIIKVEEKPLSPKGETEEIKA
jgi:hypothetical protein